MAVARLIAKRDAPARADRVVGPRIGALARRVNARLARDPENRRKKASGGLPVEKPEFLEK